jgi:hypothetical protein
VTVSSISAFQNTTSLRACSSCVSKGQRFDARPGRPSGAGAARPAAPAPHLLPPATPPDEEHLLAAPLDSASMGAPRARPLAVIRAM